MELAATLPAIFARPLSLPRGPHGLSRGEVSAIHRGRLLDAVTRVVADEGYGPATVAQIIRRAGVSPNVFYEHFVSKQACYLAAYDLFAESLLGRIAGEIEPAVQWREFVSGALNAYLGTLDNEPIAARAFLLEMDAAGPLARERRHAAYAAIAAAIQQRHKEMCNRDPSLSPLPDSAYMGIVHGVRELVCDVLEGRSVSQLRDLAPDVEAWITAAFRGAGGPGGNPSNNPIEGAYK